MFKPIFFAQTIHTINWIPFEHASIGATSGTLGYLLFKIQINW
jgi:hypothetical protein